MTILPQDAYTRGYARLDKFNTKNLSCLSDGVGGDHRVFSQMSLDV